MTLTLPAFHDLSEDQDEVLTLPVDASALVVGAPGTGKTIMALHRARMLHGQEHPTLLLMYNRLLSAYTRDAVETLGLDSLVLTYNQWLDQWWRRYYRSSPPTTGPWQIDWMECKRILITEPPTAYEKQHVIIDEGQDLPADFYLILRLISRSIVVFADDNQRITDNQSTSREIRARTGIKRTLRLTRNRRNSRAIAGFAADFHVGAAADRAELPSLSPADQPPALLSFPDVDREVAHLVDYERENPQETIGVLLPRIDDVRRFYSLLSGFTRNPVQLHLNRTRLRPQDIRVDLATPGIKVLTWAGCKGVEFDSVFLPELQRVVGDPAGDDLRMKLYVACTRARRRLTLMYAGQGEPTLVKHLPHALLLDLRP
ncbi:3'-5' exonuclease [Polymorphospora rubra]|uniref:3'-5' exonuclease n=1 Tax=Polymorphospora rubra TaxID=338584 RepID=UPI0034004298